MKDIIDKLTSIANSLEFENGNNEPYFIDIVEELRSIVKKLQINEN